MNKKDRDSKRNIRRDCSEKPHLFGSAQRRIEGREFIIKDKSMING